MLQMSQLIFVWRVPLQTSVILLHLHIWLREAQCISFFFSLKRWFVYAIRLALFCKRVKMFCITLFWLEWITEVYLEKYRIVVKLFISLSSLSFDWIYQRRHFIFVVWHSNKQLLGFSTSFSIYRRIHTLLIWKLS